jgi:hypothetical protein
MYIRPRDKSYWCWRSRENGGWTGMPHANSVGHPGNQKGLWMGGLPVKTCYGPSISHSQSRRRHEGRWINRHASILDDGLSTTQMKVQALWRQSVAWLVGLASCQPDVD